MIETRNKLTRSHKNDKRNHATIQIHITTCSLSISLCKVIPLHPVPPAPSPTHTSPRSLPHWERLPLSLLPTADSHSCCPCLADGLPQPALLLLLLPNCYQSLSLFFVLLPPATSPFLCKWTAPICSASPALATSYQPLFTALLCRRTAPIHSSYYSYSACSAYGLPPFLALHSLRLLSHTPAAAAGG